MIEALAHMLFPMRIYDAEGCELYTELDPTIKVNVDSPLMAKWTPQSPALLPTIRRTSVRNPNRTTRPTLESSGESNVGSQGDADLDNHCGPAMVLTLQPVRPETV